MCSLDACDSSQFAQHKKLSALSEIIVHSCSLGVGPLTKQTEIG